MVLSKDFSDLHDGDKGECWHKALKTPEKNSIKNEFRKIEDELQATKAEMFISNRKVIQVREEERRRIARDLHDETAQLLAALNLELEILISGNQKSREYILEKLKAIRKYACQALQELRHISHELYPSVLDNLGLIPALKELVRETNSRGILQAELRVAGQVRKLEEENNLVIFRIAQQALNNIWQHSGSSRARIKLTFEEDKVILSVVDRGRGFNVQRETEDAVLRGCLGLIGMQENARLAHARLKIRSRSGLGTVVSLDLDC